MRKGFHDPYSNDGHDEGLAGDGLSEWHPAFLPGWGSKLLGRDPSAGSSSSGLGKGGPTAGLAARGRAFQAREWNQAKTHRTKTRGLRGAMGFRTKSTSHERWPEKGHRGIKRGRNSVQVSQ